MTPVTRDQYCKEIIGSFDKALARHEILDRFGTNENCNESDMTAGWTVGIRGRSEMLSQVIVSRRLRYLSVVGDFDPVVYQFCPYHSPHKEILEWIACSELDYVWQKAKIGMGHYVATQWVSAVALDSALHYMKQVESEPNPWNDVVEAIRRSDAMFEVQKLINEIDFEICDMGDVPAHRVIFGWRVCKRLLDLLDQEK